MPESPKDSNCEQFMQLFIRHERQVYSHLMTLLANSTEVEELFQQTSLILWQKFSEFQPGTNFGAWACRVAYWEVMAYRTRQGRDRLIFSDDIVEQLASDAADMRHSLDSRRRALSECMEKLNEKDRDLVSRRYKAGATATSVAEEIGLSMSAVYKALRRICDSLFQCIDRVLAREGNKS